MCLGGKSRQAHKHSKMERPPKAEAEIAQGSPIPPYSLPLARHSLLLLCYLSLCFFLPLQVLFCSRHSSAGLQGYTCLTNLQAAGLFFFFFFLSAGDSQKSWFLSKAFPLEKAAGSMPLHCKPTQHIPGVCRRAKRLAPNSSFNQNDFGYAGFVADMHAYSGVEVGFHLVHV